MFGRASVGLDVHARSVAGCALDTETGEILHRKLTPDRTEILDWIRSLPRPVRVVYEAGPTGFGLDRDLITAGFETAVAAPPKLQRPSGDRVTNDARDALHLARLLKPGEITGVRIPSTDQDASRARGDNSRYTYGKPETAMPDIARPAMCSSRTLRPAVANQRMSV